MSKPAVHSATAADRYRISGSKEPRTAIQAAAGAMPSAAPSTRCDSAVKRFVYEYPSAIASANGLSRRQRGLSIAAARQKTALESATNAPANPRESVPDGSAPPPLCEGSAPSSEASARRLKAMAAERAATIATTIQPSFQATSPAARPESRRASSAPVSANGRAKTECWNLMASRTRAACRRNAFIARARARRPEPSPGPPAASGSPPTRNPW